MASYDRYPSTLLHICDFAQEAVVTSESLCSVVTQNMKYVGIPHSITYVGVMCRNKSILEPEMPTSAVVSIYEVATGKTPQFSEVLQFSQ